MFDEMHSIRHSSRLMMRIPGMFLVFAASLAVAVAQSTAPSTNAPLSYVSSTNTSLRDPSAVTRPLSLPDCIQLALQNNLDLAVVRYDPQIALYALRGAYGIYDPAFTFSGQHEHDEAGFRLLSGGFTVPGSRSDVDSFGIGLGPGLLPWGMTYSIQGNASDSYGRSFDVDTNGVILPRPFENSVGSVAATVTQPLLRNFWIDAPRMAIRISKNRLQWSELDFKLQVMLIITTLEQAYYDLIFNRQNVIVQQKAVELAEKLAIENRRRVEVGAMAPLDAKQAEAQFAQSRADLYAAQSNLGVQENLLKQLVTSNYSAWAGIVLEPTGTLTAVKREFNLQESWQKGLTRRPEIMQAKLDVERAGIQLKYDRNQLLPQVDLFATYGYNGSGNEFSGTLFDIQERNRPTWAYGGSISIPLANTAARNSYKASKLSMQQAVLLVKRWERDIMRQIDDDIKRAQASFEQVAATRAAREYNEEALAAEQKKLDQGKSTTYTVLQMQRDLTAARGAEIQALDNYNKNLSQLSLDEGTTLERLGITLEVK